MIDAGRRGGAEHRSEEAGDDGKNPNDQPTDAATDEHHASESRFHELLDAVTDYAIYMLDATGHVATWNVGAQRTKGYEAHEVLGQHFSVFYTEEDRIAGKPDRVLATVRREGRFEDEGWRVRKDGTRFWANVVVTPLRGRDGEVTGFAKVTRDLTAKRALDEQLHASESRFHELVDAVTDYAIYMLDATGHVATWNVGAQRNKGYQAHEILGQHFSVFYTEEDRIAGKPDHVLATVRREGRFEDEGWRVRKDGTQFWANIVVTALRGRDGEVTGFAKVTRDLTAQRALDEQLHASESRFHELVDAVTDYAIYMLDATGHVATWNVGAQRNKGYQAHEILGQHFSVFYTEEDRIAGKPDHVLATVRREGRFEDEAWRVRKDGTRFWANVVVTALRDRDGEVIGFAKVTRDLTAQRAAEDGRRQLTREQMAREVSELARREMERASRLKDEFLATMSHELRTPLNAITGWAAILRKKPREEMKLERGLEVIERNARAQGRLVSDLLDVSRIVNGKLQLNVAKLEVLPSIMAAADVVRPAAEGKGVRLVVDVDPGIGATMADGDRLQQIVWNLLTNAVRFTPRGGRVTITGDRASSSIQIVVRDTGAGIAAEHLPYIFERFKQVDSSTTRAHGGLGLGLAIVRHLVEAHGGSVEVESAGLGLGTTFTVFLPIGAVNTAAIDLAGADVERADSVAPNPDERRVRLDALRVLVVDDDEDSLEVLREVLELAGAHVTTVTSARLAFDAIDAGGAKGFAVIISDIGMPEMDGYSFIRDIRARRHAASDVPAIALTAYARTTDATRALDAGFQQHLIKPIDERQLLQAVEMLSRGAVKVS
jgi:PAS domain S-box-containing protein